LKLFIKKNAVLSPIQKPAFNPRISGFETFAQSYKFFKYFKYLLNYLEIIANAKYLFDGFTQTVRSFTRMFIKIDCCYPETIDTTVMPAFETSFFTKPAPANQHFLCQGSLPVCSISPILTYVSWALS
jgi:hypothetical protein